MSLVVEQTTTAQIQLCQNNIVKAQSSIMLAVRLYCKIVARW